MSTTAAFVSSNGGGSLAGRRGGGLMASAAVSLADYTNFHGMLCSPNAASRCINSFAGGTILFMPSTYTPETFATFDCSTKGVLTPISYYMLVFLSLTGLSTMLGLTDFRMAKEFPPTAIMDKDDADNGKTATTPNEEVMMSATTSKYNSLLRVEDYVLDYCKHFTNAKSISLKRCFEYKFKLVGLEVIMVHYECDQNKLHLVEVYHFNNFIWQDWVAPTLLSLGKAFRNSVVARRRERSTKKIE